MAAGLNQAFMNDPREFMRTHVIHVPSQGGGGHPLSGIAVCGLYPRDDRNPGGRDVSLGLFERFHSHWHVGPSHPIPAYVLYGVANQDNRQVLPNHVNYMFTMVLTGCQFLAYGPTRGYVTVEHNNYFSGKAADYAAHWQAVQAGNRLHALVRPNWEYHVASGAYVVGVREADGWHFYLRQNLCSDNAFVIRY
jgi:hypothetical protein